MRDTSQTFSGVAGGSSLVPGTMQAWDLSGLAVGYELGKLGYDCRILEARDRVGGVSHTIRRGTEETDLDGRHQR